MSFLSVWTADTLRLFGASLEIMRNMAPKRSGPGAPTRAKTIFPVIDRSSDSTRETIKFTLKFLRSPGYQARSRVFRRSPQEGVAVGEAAGEAAGELVPLAL
jgi:hypothetical protein